MLCAFDLRWLYRAALDECFDPFGELAARHQHPAPAAQAAHADVRADPDYAPLITSTRVRLAQGNYIFETDVDGIDHANP
jgi:hypothetical protein